MRPRTPDDAIARSTFLALCAPRRAIPILFVCVPLVWLQGILSRDPAAAPLGILMCVAFVCCGPVSYRLLFPNGLESDHGGARILAYAAIGAAVILVIGRAIPRALDMHPTLLTVPSSLIVCFTLFLVGGWGLGRDIGFEVSLRRERARAEALAVEAERAQLLAMRAHLDPHFLFNTLSAIAEWCREDGEVAERAVLELSAMLRAMLAGVKTPSWPLSSELDLARSLVALHALRDPGRFGASFEVPEALPETQVPPLLLLPLVENAFKHGPGAGHEGAIAIRVIAGPGANAIAFEVENPGPYRGPREGSDGLPTVKRRLALAYGGRAELVVTGDAGSPRTRVTVTLPAEGPTAGVSV